MIYAGGKQIAERRIRNADSTISQEGTFLIELDPGGTERWEKFIDVQNYQFERDEGYDILDPFGAGVGYENPYPTEPPSPNDPNADCDYTDHGHGEQEPYNCTLPDDFDDQSDEDSQVGSVPENTYYNGIFKVDFNDMKNDPEDFEPEGSGVGIASFSDGSRKFVLRNNGDGTWDTQKYHQKPTLKTVSKQEQKRRKQQRQVRGIEVDQETEINIIPYNVEKIREGISLVWQTDGCPELIQELLTAVSSKSNPIIAEGNMPVLFDMLMKQKHGGLTRTGVNRGASSSAHGTLKNGDAVVSIGPQPNDTEQAQIITDVKDTIAELLHIAGDKNYSDLDFAKVVKLNPTWAGSNWENDYFKIPTIYPDDDPTYTKEQRNLLKVDQIPYGHYWHPVVDNLCLSKVDWSKLF